MWVDGFFLRWCLVDDGMSIDISQLPVIDHGWSGQYFLFLMDGGWVLRIGKLLHV